MENNKVTEKLTMPNLYQKLEDIGFSKDFVRAIGLPSWWIDELDESNLAVLEACLHISKRLLIDLKSLIDPTQKAQFRTYMVYEKITYERVLEIIKNSKNYLIEHPEALEDDSISPDTEDYYEQLLQLDI